MNSVPKLLSEIPAPTANDEECALILFASPESRCLGVARRLLNYRAAIVCIFEIGDEPNAERDKNVASLCELCQIMGHVEIVHTRHESVLYGLDDMIGFLQTCPDHDGRISVDISTFPKNSLLVTLRVIERCRPESELRILYTEPGEYKLVLDQPLSFGLRQTMVVPTFIAPYHPNEELVLIMFLGYERDRALGVWQCIQPHKTLLVLGDPPYHPEWVGVSERLNCSLLAGFGPDSIYRVDPRNPLATCDLLRRIVNAEGVLEKNNFFIAPLGTKPQALGAYLFCSEFPQAATLIYATPLENNHAYISKGVGDTWVLPFKAQIK